MSFSRSVLFLIIVTILASAALLFFGSAQGYKNFNSGYAVIFTDTSIEESVLLGLLEKSANNFTGVPVSESTQWVLLDEFGSLQKIPLDKYSERLFPFDPRNDGYAEKLRELFVIDGRKVIYVPINTGVWNSAILDRQFKNLLGDINISIEYYGIVKPVYLFFTAYITSLIGLLIICYVKKMPYNCTVNLLPLTPVLSSLSFFGVSGIISSAVIFGFFILMREPLGDFMKLQADCSKDNTQMLKLIKKEIFNPYKLYWPVLPVFIILLGAVIFFSQVNPLFFLAVFIISLFIYLFSCKTMPALAGKRRRFNPVLIIKNRFPDFSFSICISPFVIFSFIIILFIPNLPAQYVSNRNFNIAVNENDYHEHIFYQATFSRRQLGSPISSFQNYIYDEYGLPVPGETANLTVDYYEYPPFPLQHMADFFNNVKNDANTNDFRNTSFNYELIFAVILTLLILSSLFIKSEDNDIKKINIKHLKKINGNIRFKGINRNKSLLYNNNNEILIRKDA